MRASCPASWVYFVLFVIGTVVPYVSFLPWVIDYGFDVSRMVEELFANRISAFFGLDVVISTIPLGIRQLGGAEGRPQAPVGVRCRKPDGRRLSALPLFLFMREIRLERLTGLAP